MNTLKCGLLLLLILTTIGCVDQTDLTPFCSEDDAPVVKRIFQNDKIRFPPESIRPPSRVNVCREPKNGTIEQESPTSLVYSPDISSGIDSFIVRQILISAFDTNTTSTKFAVRIFADTAEYCLSRFERLPDTSHRSTRFIPNILTSRSMYGIDPYCDHLVHSIDILVEPTHGEVYIGEIDGKPDNLYYIHPSYDLMGAKDIVEYELCEEIQGEIHCRKFVYIFMHS